MGDAIKILILIMSLLAYITFLAWYNFNYFLKFIKWFLSTFNKEYTPAGELKPDFKKLIGGTFTALIVCIALDEIYQHKFNNEIWYGLLFAIGSIFGFSIAPLFNKQSSAIKMEELKASTKSEETKNQDETATGQ